jgi:Zn-dependent protease
MQLRKKEIQSILIVAFIAAFIFSFNEWGIENFNITLGIQNLILAFVFCLIIYTVHAFSQKFTANFYDHDVEFTYISMKKKIAEIRKTITIPIGPLLTLLITLISNGKFIFLILNSFNLKTNKTRRLGHKWVNIKEFEEAQIALAGPLSNILILILFKILTPLSGVFSRGMFIASTIAIFNMLPIPKVDGSRIFFGSRPLYVASLIFIIIFVILIFQLSVLQTLILALLLSLIIGGIYLYKLNN